MMERYGECPTNGHEFEVRRAGIGEARQGNLQVLQGNLEKLEKHSKKLEGQVRTDVWLAWGD